MLDVNNLPMKAIEALIADPLMPPNVTLVLGPNSIVAIETDGDWEHISQLYQHKEDTWATHLIASLSGPDHYPIGAIVQDLLGQ